jgi:hypothetical protein
MSHLGPERWIDAVLLAIPRERKEKLQGVDRDEILNNRLFLLDLLQVIDSQWERFKHLEASEPTRRVSKAQVKVLIDFVNAHRVDAHAKDADSTEVAATALACRALDQAIEPYIS